MGMGTTFVVNPGSSSKKYALYKDGALVFSIRFEETGSEFVVCHEKGGVRSNCEHVPVSQFTHALQYALEKMQKHKVIETPDAIDRVAIRIVAPGSYFAQHRVIDEAFVAHLREVENVAPLHVPPLISEITACRKVLSQILCVGVSDSAFHQTIPEYVSAVSIPRDDALRFDIKRFGYHGLSIASVARRFPAQFHEVPARAIVCHVGSGVSIAALSNGKSVNTSMGYSPGSGIMMSSRAGDLEADTLITLATRMNMRGRRLYEYLFQEGGFKGVAGYRDLRLVLDKQQQHDADAQKALQMFVHQVHARIGAYVAQLGGLDVIVLTATAAERNSQLRALLMGGLECFGVRIDEEKNESLTGEGSIHHSDSAVEVLVLKTDEMGEMMRVAEEFTA